MLDNGASVNIIKLGSIHPKLPVRTYENIELLGIAPQSILTWGTVYLTIAGTPHKFQVVADDFPITQDGMLGRNFMINEKAVISYHRNTIMLQGDVMRPIPFLPISEAQNNSKEYRFNKK